MRKSWCSECPGGVRLALQITPNAKKGEVIGVLDDVLKVRLQAQPIEGKANQALVRYLADMLDLPKSAITITHGHASKRKLVDITARGVTLDSVTRALLGSA